ncbi:ribose transport system permease protein [Rhodobium orientis]|uniref:ABC transporter permease n=1 Tax=Rhodobium orientis TaxID=34017 RepID=A0A327JYK1_9HYPH|nr:ABC transporter permease [Rhodobium orientis]MBB4301720.1 ribose transport system permease protein [Rhodobium orientis]MBK5950523.1 ABC transporter permease [Rhodobium orientis]RAI28168.1 ABC transporter permease [Rhodobium orientis]
MSSEVAAETASPAKRTLASRIAAVPLLGVFTALVVIFVVSCMLSPHFLTPYNMTIISRTLAFVGLVTLGQSMLMILGELDLSLGAIAGLCGVVGGIMMVQMGWNPWLSFALCLALGTFCGMFNGFLVVALRLHSLVLTIGMAGVYGGANLVATKGVAITGIPDAIRVLGNSKLYGVPVPFVILVVALIVITFMAVKTPFGRYLYAIGNNPPAARMLGIRVDTIRVLVFAAAGFLSALAGMLMVARLGTAQPSIGEGWVLAPIAASVIGGVATTGGVGSPIGAILGAAIIGIIENIIVLFGVSPYWQSMVSGAIVVLAISFDSISRRYLRREG